MSHFAGLKRATTCRACAIDIYAFRESRNSTLKQQDVIVALKLSLSESWAGYAILGQDLGMSMSEVHAAIRRLVESQLYDGESNHVRRRRLFEFIIHGLPVVYPARPKDVTRGVPTAWAAPVLANTPLAEIAKGDDLPPVWSDPDGQVRGREVEPLYFSAPAASKKDPELYALLALVDAVRFGRARERKMAEQELEKRLVPHGSS
jgi:hypothetical protein